MIWIHGFMDSTLSWNPESRPRKSTVPGGMSNHQFELDTSAANAD